MSVPDRMGFSLTVILRSEIMSLREQSDLMFDLLQITDEYGEDLEVTGTPEFCALSHVGGDVIVDGQIPDIVDRLRLIIREIGAGHELQGL